MTGTSIRLAGKRTNVVHHSEPRQRDERDLVAVRTPEDVGTEKSRNAAHRREQLLQQEPLVVIRGGVRRPAPPHSSERHVGGVSDR
jgi:hypothetical protein